MPIAPRKIDRDRADCRAHTREVAIESPAQGIIDRAIRWIARDREISAMQRRWQGLETVLFAQAAHMELDCEALLSSDLPEARQMRVLDAAISDGHAQLQTDAGEIRSMRATTIAAALAKVELGLKVQGQFDWRPNALELVEDGIRELRSLL